MFNLSSPVVLNTLTNRLPETGLYLIGTHMINNKLSGITWIRFLMIFVVATAMVACSSAPPQPKQVPEPAKETAATPPPAEPVAEAVATPPQADVFKPDYPERYVVKKGDTLWDIASRFLHDPWLWPKVWHINPEIRNPHLIYPGDVITLHFVDGKRYLTLEGVGGTPPPKGVKTVKLSPNVRYRKLDAAIESIPRSAIGPFLQRPRVITEEQLKNAPYIVASFEDHLISSSGNRIYAKNIVDQNISLYDVVRPGEVYRDPQTDEILGYEVMNLAGARVVRAGEPTTLVLADAKMEVLNGDLLIPTEKMELDFNFIPFPPSSSIDGQIIAVFNGVSQIGQYNVVVLNRGIRDGLEPGHVLAIYQRGRKVHDPRGGYTSTVTLPSERAGVLMVFRSYDKVSYALVMNASRQIHLYDLVTNP